MSQMNDDSLKGQNLRHHNDSPTLHTTKYETKVLGLHKLYILFYSLIAALLSFALPIFTDGANSLQSQNLYIGMMLTKGQVPYSDVFTTGGLVYFVLIAISYLLGSTLCLLLFEIIAFYFTGIYFYKLVNYFSSSQKVASAFTLVYFLVSVSIGFGGLYPVQFALPFVLMSLWFLTKYFVNLTKDETFILFGFYGAVAMLIEPRTLLFWALSSLTIIIYNSKEKQIGRGLYQLLAAIFGMLLVFYTAGYFILNLQILGPYLAQAIKYQFTYFQVGTLPLLLACILQFFVLLGFGILTGLTKFFRQRKEVEDSLIKWLLTFVIIAYAVMTVLTLDYHLNLFLFYLPFGLILISIPISEKLNTQLSHSSHRRVRNKRGNGRVLGIYFAKFIYLPLVLIFLSLFLNGQEGFKQFEQGSARQEVAAYLSQKVGSSEKIYVWDDSSKIYLDSKLKSASQFASPYVNLQSKEHQKILEDELLQNSAIYFVHNRTKKLPLSIQKLLRKNYIRDTKLAVKGFHIYKQK
ncbi:DUF2079 domain-containing protein [Streptococcus catagoni]|uniref:DUF2079 domain-containing protein n=1 Tax=Streptococcus catagoni TaxID=2654874 RepID=UPI00140C5033|nr:DUF2079 domain-containing protein [Streptococcus catagoni]